MEDNSLQSTLTVWTLWDEMDFLGKELYYINDAQQICVKQTSLFKEKPLFEVNVENFANTIQSLQEKFQEFKTKIDEIDQEWEQHQDKIKLASKIEKNKEYLAHANMIGHLQPLVDSLIAKEQYIKNLYDRNLQIRLAIVAKAEHLKEQREWKETTQLFKTLMDEWKSAPVVEKNKVDELWSKIEAARNQFYEHKRVFQEELEQKMLENLDLKLELCELAEGLAASTDWKETTQAFKDLIERWKAVGRVASPEKNEELWNRFMNAQNAFYDQKKLNFEKIQSEQEANLLEKTALVEQAEAYQNDINWKTTTQLYNDITEKWKSIGRVPKENADALWNRFQEAKNVFFTAKRQSAENHRINLEDNYAKKLALVKRIETIQHSTNWKETTDEINNLLTEWKTIGPVPREVSDEIWERFIGARNNFFKRKDTDREDRRNHFYNKLDSRIEQTTIFLNKIKEELVDDRSKVAEFEASLKDVDINEPKGKDLIANLEMLIQQTQSRIPNKEAKIDEVRIQLNELLAKKEEILAQQSNAQPSTNDTTDL